MDWLTSNSDSAPGGCATHPPNLHGCSSVDRARLCEGRGHRFESCQLYQTLFGARPMAGCETLTLEIVVRVHGAEPKRLVSRPTVGLRIPNPLIGVRIVAGQPIHAVAERLGTRLQPSLSRFNSERHVQHSPVAQSGIEQPSHKR